MLKLMLNLMPNLPEGAVVATGWAAGAGALAGGFLWLAGSRFNRSLATLAMVSIGAGVGVRLPRWMDLSVGSWATAVGAALVLGIFGYSLHRLWAGIALALLLGGWAAAGMVGIYEKKIEWSRVLPGRRAELPVMASRAWEGLPGDVRRIGPFACGIGVVTGLGVAIAWSRLAVMIFYSLAGMTLVVLLAPLAALLLRPRILESWPRDWSTQAAAVAGLVVFGVVVQWRMSPRAAPEETGSAEG